MLHDRFFRDRYNFGRKAAITLAIALSALLVAGSSARVSDQTIADQLRRSLETAPIPIDLEIGGERLLARMALPAFYEQRAYRPAWISSLGPHSSALDLVGFLRTLPQEGLHPDDYHAHRLQRLLTGISDGALTASAGAHTELELLLTDAYLMVAAHLVSGRVDPTTFDREWLAVRREVDIVGTLKSALESGAISEALESLLPNHPGYRRLRELGDQYRRIADSGGWPPVPEGPSFKIGESSSRVVNLRRHLSITDGFASDGSDVIDQELFDEGLDAALRRFQARHGLEPDGVVGAKTLTALNVPAEQRLHQIYLNLERWRWLPQDLGDRYVLVNLPGFDLRAVKGDQVLLEMRVAVGRRYRRTPVFSDTIRYLVFNPSWEIPAGIAVNDKLPEIQKDSSYLQKQGIRVLAGWGTDQRELDPITIDWSSLGSGNFPYRLRQDPGPLNALGRVKFMFPNRFNVYLHDTPGREVFRQSERDVSSGCIRLEKPLELAELLLEENKSWIPGATQDFVRDYREQTVRLDGPWAVHILHWSAWVAEDQVAHFRPDLYERDDKLSNALGQELP